MLVKRVRKSQKGGRRSKSRHGARKHVKNQTRRGRKVKKRRKTRRNYRPSSSSLKNFIAMIS